MTLTSGLDIPTERVAEICRRYHVTEMSVFGSAVHGGMRDDSDVDITRMASSSTALM
jgi:predicted nucleotidyltransferase